MSMNLWTSAVLLVLMTVMKRSDADCLLGEWDQVSGALSSISVGGDGTLWGVASDNSIWAYDYPTNGWQNVPGSLVQISVGSRSNIWGVNPDGAVLYRDFAANTWVTAPGYMKQVSVASDGTVWAVNDAGNIYKAIIADSSFYPVSFLQVAGGLDQISVGSASNVWGTIRGEIYKRNAAGTGWDKVYGEVESIEVSSTGDAWGVTQGGQIWRYDETNAWKWYRVCGTGIKSVTLDDGYYYALSDDDRIWKITLPSNETISLWDADDADADADAGVNADAHVEASLMNKMVLGAAVEDQTSISLQWMLASAVVVSFIVGYALYSYCVRVQGYNEYKQIRGAEEDYGSLKC